MDEKMKENIRRFILCIERKHDCKYCKYEQKCYDELASFEPSFRDKVLNYLREVSKDV